MEELFVAASARVISKSASRPSGSTEEGPDDAGTGGVRLGYFLGDGLGVLEVELEEDELVLELELSSTEGAPAPEPTAGISVDATSVSSSKIVGNGPDS